MRHAALDLYQRAAARHKPSTVWACPSGSINMRPDLHPDTRSDILGRALGRDPWRPAARRSRAAEKGSPGGDQALLKLLGGAGEARRAPDAVAWRVRGAALSSERARSPGGQLAAERSGRTTWRLR